MITLHEGKHYIIDGTRIAKLEELPQQSAQQAKEATLTYRVLASHNRGGDMENLDIRFDSMGVYDNTYVGILQTARASGLEKFPIPCVFTNCHNCLCAVGGTLNADLHKYAVSACVKYGGIYVPPHEAVIHQYMREMIVNSGEMSIVSDSHTRYGTQGSLSIGEGGPELVKTMVGKGYALKYPKTIAVFLTGSPKPWVGPHDIALSIIGKVFKNNFVKNAKRVFENNKNITCDMQSKVVDGKIHVDQGVVAGCCSGSFSNIYSMSKIAEHIGNGLGAFGLNIYPASQPIMVALNKSGAMTTLMEYGARIKSAFCGPCFGAGDTPANNDFSIRHTTRNFPNREGSNPAMGQIASVALMDARSIAATAFSGGVLTSAEDVWEDFDVPEYTFDAKIYERVVYNGFGKAKPETEMVYGPDIKDWPEMSALTDDLLLRVASVIRDEVTTTDELIPSGETASYRSNPEKISQFTLIRKDPEYVGRTKKTREYERARVAGDTAKSEEFYTPLRMIGVTTPVEELMKTTGIGSVLYAKRPGDGSAREYAASCQKVLGGLANICIEYATKRYRSNCVNWGILPFTNPDDNIDLAVDEYIYLKGIRKAVEDGRTHIDATVIAADGKARILPLDLPEVTEDEKRILLAGSLINSYKL